MSSPAVAATLGFAAGLALEAALQKVSIEASLRSAGSDDMKFSLKWPNDVLAGRQKLAGILLEAEAVAGDRLAVVVGIGTNVDRGTRGHANARRPRSRRSASMIGAEELFAVLSDCWAEFRGIWDDGRGFGEIRRLWLERAAGLGERVAIQSGGSTIEGTFDTLDELGLHGRPDARWRAGPDIAAGDVYFGSAASAGAA